MLPVQPPNLPPSEGQIFSGQLPFTDRPQAIQGESAPLDSTVTLQSKLSPCFMGGWGLVSTLVTWMQVVAAWERISWVVEAARLMSIVVATIMAMEIRAKSVISPLFDSFRYVTLSIYSIVANLDYIS